MWNGVGRTTLGDGSCCIGEDFCGYEEKAMACLYVLSYVRLTGGLTMFPEGTRLKPKTLKMVLLVLISSDLVESGIFQEDRLAYF
jgi:hypothetical protein